MLRKSTKSFKERALKDTGPKHRVNSKVKGNRNEIEVAKALTKWVGVAFRRTPASGAIHIPLHWLSGDVFCTSENFNFPFSVETKHYAKITVGLVSKWQKQAKADADRINKIPMLITRENGMPKGEWVIHIPSKEIPGIWRSWSSTKVFSMDYHKFVKLYT